MTKAIDPVRQALADVLPQEGFQRKGTSWFRQGDEIVEVVNLQKSQFGEQYYLNYALWFRRCGEEPFPKEEKCHIRVRADQIVSGEAQMTTLLDLDSGLQDSARILGLAAVLRNEILPFANGCRTEQGVREALEKGAFRNAMVHAKVKQVLGS